MYENLKRSKTIIPDRLVLKTKLPKIKIDQGNCDTCGVCVDVCPVGVLTLRGGAVSIEDENACLGGRASQSCSSCSESDISCSGCVACVRNCPSGAIIIQ